MALGEEPGVGTVMISGPQYRKLMQTYQETGKITASASKAGMDRKTAAKYLRGGASPGQKREPRQWRTRTDPFGGVWKEVEGWLSAKPDLEATSALEELLRLYPKQFEEKHLRSLQRRFRRWRDEQGHLGKPVYFEQCHEPGRLLQLDWFHPRDFEVTIGGELYRHLLCHTVLTYSNWEWAQPCRSESFASLKGGLQAGLWEAGGVVQACQVDNSSTATHQLGKGRGKRAFNERFLGLLAHYGMRAQTIQVGAANENGDVESAHSHLRHYLADALQFRGSSDFGSVEEYTLWLEERLRQRNQRRASKFAEEMAVMAPLPPCRLAEYEEVDCRVNKYSLVRVGKGSYSVPSKHRTHRLRACLYESRIELWHEQTRVAAFDRHANAGGACVDWRHLIEDLCRKPGAFARYRYRESFYPSLTWREVNDELRKRFSTGRADSDYLQMLRLSLEHGMERMEELLGRLKGTPQLTLDRIRRELGEQEKWRDSGDDIEADLDPYDLLLSKEVAHG
jgi:hypothetical protein